MEHTQKMVLVPFDAYKQPTPSSPQVTNSLNEKMVSLDREMESVLKDNMLSEMQKVNKYAKVMQEYMEYRRKKKIEGGGEELPKELMTPMNEKTDNVVDSKIPSPDEKYHTNNVIGDQSNHTPPKKSELDIDTQKNPEVMEIQDTLPGKNQPDGVVLNGKSITHKQKQSRIKLPKSYDFTKRWLY